MNYLKLLGEYSYIIQVSISLLILYGFYIFFLRKESFFVVNRVYLISTLILSISLPLVWLIEFDNNQFSIDSGNEITVFITENLPKTNLNPASQELGEVESTFFWQQLVFYIYLTGCAISLFLFAKSLFSLFKLISRHKLERKEGYCQIDLPDSYPTFSFFNIIFLNKKELATKDAAQIILHEKAHVKQWHSLDIIFAELVSIAFWFHPACYAYKNELRKVHEYLADDYVLKSGIGKEAYANLLVEEILQSNALPLANNFFSINILKSRIMMMHKSKPRLLAKSKLLFALPVFAFLAIVGACSNQLNNQMQLKEFELFGYTRPHSNFANYDLVEKNNAANKELPSLITKALKEGNLQAYSIDFSSENPLGKELSIEEIEENYNEYWGTVKENGKEYITIVDASTPQARKETYPMDDPVLFSFRADEMNGGETFITMSIGAVFRPTGRDKHIASFKLEELEKAIGAKISMITKPYPY
ncbi:M56 family metallopeptidase [Flammeovirgaceae bacterium SG7u.111]|nr:M56 family metallopeptidase [Flammeovirgaceae bacterium SG7u.132]WPO34118.1 M56 family metallopeptidase [Flammeovirgaceae bacterium SG7u.111]